MPRTQHPARRARYRPHGEYRTAAGLCRNGVGLFAFIQSSAALIAKLVRGRGGVLAEETGKVRGIGKPSSWAISWIGCAVKTSWRSASVSRR